MQANALATPAAAQRNSDPSVQVGEQNQFAALAQQFELLKLQLEAQAKREQAQALAKMQAQFAQAASTEKTRETNAQRFEKTFEAFAAEMKENYDALAAENRQLKAEMKKAEAREAAATAAHRVAQEALLKEVAELKAQLRDTTGDLKTKVYRLEKKAEMHDVILDNHTHRVSGGWQPGNGWNPDYWTESHTGKRDIHGPSNVRKDPTN